MATHEIIQLIDDYLDGSADEAIVSPLKDWLEADAANLDFFARQVFLHQQMREFLAADDVAQSLADATTSVAATEAKPIVFPDLPGSQSGGIPGSAPVVSGPRRRCCSW